MGNTSYNVKCSTARSTSYSTKSTHEIFSCRRISEDMNPLKISLREARDSDVHPCSIPIILALDVTGSMGHIPDRLVKGGLTKIMSTIIQNGVNDAAVMFMGVGDHTCDSAPLQIGQFESGDAEMDKWLTSIFLESGGGANEGESYFLPWYFANKYIQTDHWTKRNKKGFLFTIGDEPLLLDDFSIEAQRTIMGGNGQYKVESITSILKEAQEKWNVFHLLTSETYRGSLKHTQDQWKQLLGENCIIIPSYEEIPTKISEILISNLKNNAASEHLINSQEEFDPWKV